MTERMAKTKVSDTMIQVFQAPPRKGRQKAVEVIRGFGPDRQPTEATKRGERIIDSRHRGWDGALDLTGLEGGAGTRNSPGGNGTIERGKVRQEEVCVHYVEQRGGRVKILYVEEGVSASKQRTVLIDGRKVKRVIRPTFEQAVQDLYDGVVDFLVWEELDRIVRDRRQGLDLIEVVELTGRPILDTFGYIDLSHDNGKEDFMRRVDAAATESRRKSQRTTGSRKAGAMAGYPLQTKRAFGWTFEGGRKKQSIIEDEAEVLRSAVELILRPGSKTTVYTIASAWYEQGVRTVNGNRWQAEKIRAALLSPRMAGWSIHRKQIARDWAGEPVKSKLYDAIITPQQYEELCRKLKPTPEQEQADRAAEEAAAEAAGLPMPPKKRKAKRAAGSGRKYENSGLYVHASCGSNMYGNAFGPTFRWQCGNDSDIQCGRGSIDGPKSDKLVKEWVLDAHREEAERTEAVEPWGKELEYQRLLKKKKAIFARLEKGDDPEDVLEAAAPITRKIKALETERRDHAKRERRAAAAIIRLAEVWDDLTPLERRAYTDSTLDKVLVFDATRPARLGFDRSRLKPVPRGSTVQSDAEAEAS